MLEVLSDSKYTMTPRADADIARYRSSLVTVTKKIVLAIAGFAISGNFMSSVSSYDTVNDTWKGGLANLNHARYFASACLIQASVYVFCGKGYGGALNSIETIMETSLVLPDSEASWKLIEVSFNTLTSHMYPSVAPINETEIAILGGEGDNILRDVVVFDTSTSTCEKLINIEYKFRALGNQCAQVGKNKVITLARCEDSTPAVISWTKGANAATILHRFGK